MKYLLLLTVIFALSGCMTPSGAGSSQDNTDITSFLADYSHAVFRYQGSILAEINGAAWSDSLYVVLYNIPQHDTLIVIRSTLASEGGRYGHLVIGFWLNSLGRQSMSPDHVPYRTVERERVYLGGTIAEVQLHHDWWYRYSLLAEESNYLTIERTEGTMLRGAFQGTFAVSLDSIDVEADRWYEHFRDIPSVSIEEARRYRAVRRAMWRQADLLPDTLRFENGYFKFDLDLIQEW